MVICWIIIDGGECKDWIVIVIIADIITFTMLISDTHFFIQCSWIVFFSLHMLHFLWEPKILDIWYNEILFLFNPD